MLRRLESFLRSKIEGFFNKRFQSDLEILELKQAMAASINEQAIANKERKICNDYCFKVCASDYQRLCTEDTIRELYRETVKNIILEDAFLQSELRIHFSEDDSLTSGTFKLLTSDDNLHSVSTKDTLVIPRTKFIHSYNAPYIGDFAVLKVTLGADEDSSLDFGINKVYIGRQDKNDFILTDTKTSRLHACITYEGHRHIISDAHSTNGTFVNGRQISSMPLKVGDEIKIGDSLLVYYLV